MSVDTEIKFISTANTQIKFYNRNLQIDVFKKIERLLLALNIPIEQKTSALRENSTTRDDAYFDDGWRLADNGCSLSIRTYHGKRADQHLPDDLLFKYDEITGHANGIASITRRELRAKLEDGARAHFADHGITAADLEKYFPDAELSLDPDTVLTRQGGGKIRRASYIVSVDEQPYRISVDRYYFFNRDQDKYSETFTEIEIDNHSERNEFHPRIRQVAEVLQAVFEVNAEPRSKYHRFKNFIVSDDFQEYYFVALDIVSYSVEQSWMQKQVVQLFHKIIKDQVLKSGLATSDDLTKISIGDGAVIAARMNWDNLKRFLDRIKAADETSNNTAKPGRMIAYRTAVHYGPVFSFTDLNDMINVAGNGINIVSRILGEANEAEVVLSYEAYKRILDGAPISESRFKELGERTVKHDAVVHLYQLLDE